MTEHMSGKIKRLIQWECIHAVGCDDGVHQLCEVARCGATPPTHRVHAHQTALCEAAALLVEPIALVARDAVEVVDA